MAYNLIITKRAEELLDDLIYQLINRYKNEDAAKRLLNHIGCIHDRLIDNPYQFPLIRDRYLSMKGYRIAIIPKTKYILVFDIREDSLEDGETGYLVNKIGKLIGFFNLIFGDINEEEKAITSKEFDLLCFLQKIRIVSIRKKNCLKKSGIWNPLVISQP